MVHSCKHKKDQQTSNSSHGDTITDEHYIGHFDKSPYFMRDNPSIFKGYRINFNTKRKVLKSLFMVHNESVNIWTHCLTAIIFIGILIFFAAALEDHSLVQKFKGLQREVDRQLQKYYSTLTNISREGMISQKELAQLHSLKNSLLSEYKQMLNKLHQDGQKLVAFVQKQFQGIKETVRNDFQQRIRQFQMVKVEYQKEIAPHIVAQVQHHIDGTFLNKLTNHLSKLRQHLDSDLFQKMDLNSKNPNPQQISRWPIFVFLCSAVLCLLFSTIFHLFHPLSSKAYGLLLRFDFAGISLLIAGSAVPCFYYSMYCQMAVATIYLTFTIVAALVSFIITLFEWIHRIGNQIYRSVVFGIFGFSMSVPLAHLFINQVFFDNYGDPYQFSSSLIYYVLLISCYIFGLYVFTVRCPERSNPGKYDICGHSHQIWHCMVVLGIIFTYFGLLENFQMRKQSACPA